MDEPTEQPDTAVSAGEAAATTTDAADDSETLNTAVALAGPAPAGSSAAPRPQLAAASRAQCIGRYVILGKIGKGGMGVIYRAYDPELDRKVALKLVRLRTGPEGTLHDGRDRLLREAQALAQLSHPNVVSVFDVGTVGREVFIAMEYVEGRTLRRWLREVAPTRQEVLGVLIAAGRGLAAAHRARVIHRDFKPDNVLVADDGRVRVLDFGLARAAEGPPTRTDGDPSSDDAPLSTDEGVAAIGRPDGPADASPSAGDSAEIETGEQWLRTPLTETGQRMGTPRYMAPEQHLGRDTDARTDQFSFCATAYEALYRQHAFAGEDRVVIKGQITGGYVEEPPPDSKVPARLRRVILRGLSVAPEDRYPSMDALLEELAHDPWVARRRAIGALGVAALLALALYGFLRTGAAPDDKCTGFAQELDGVWDESARETVERAFFASGRPHARFTAGRVATILDEYAAGWIAMSTESCVATARGRQSAELLDRRARCLDRLRAQLGAHVALLARGPDPALVDRAVLAALSLTPLSHCADLEALGSAAPLPAEPSAREQVAQLGARVERVKALEDAGQLKTALDDAKRIVAEARAVGHPPLLAEALYRLASLQRSLGALDAAEQSLGEVVVIAAQAHEDALTALAWIDLVGVVGYDQGRYVEGLALSRAAESALARAGTHPSARASLHGNLATILRAQGKYEQAKAEQLRAIAIKEKVLGKDHPGLAASYNNFGNVLWDRGEKRAAGEYYERALAIWERALGGDHPAVAKGLSNLGNALMAQGEHERARGLYERAIAIKTRTLGPDHPDVATSLTNLGEALKSEGKYRESLELHQRALEIWLQAYGEQHAHVAVSLHNIGSLYYMMGAYREALEHQQRALGIFVHVLGPDHPYVAYALTGLGSAYAELGDRGRAIAHLERAFRLRSEREGDPVARAETSFALAEVLWTAGRDRRRALRLAREAREAFAAAGEQNLHERLEVDTWLAARR